MMKQSLDMLLLSLAASVTLSSMGVVLGFGMHQSHSRHKHYAPRTVSSVLFQEKATWSEYKHEYVDPQVLLADHAHSKEEDRSSMEDVSYQAKQAHVNADAYWAWQFEQDHEKLHQLKEHVKHSHMSGDASRSDSESSSSLTDTWSHYKHDYIDKLPKPHSLSP